MATPATTAAALAQNRHQGGLREFVNQKLAPYVKKALKDVCDIDAEYPLQWIGEHLINQSLLYENNPDTTGIKERFFYNFDEPDKSAAGNGTAAAAAAAEKPTTTATALVNGEHTDTSNTTLAEPTLQSYNGDHAAPTHMQGTDEGYGAREQTMDMRPEESHGEVTTEMLNGVTEAARAESNVEQVNGEGVVDTEMAGTA